MVSFKWVLLLSLVLSLAAFPARGGEPGGKGRPYLIAALRLSEVDQSTFEGFKAGMTARGYREGREVEYLAPGPAVRVEALEGLVDSVLKKRPDLIFVSSTPATLAVQRKAEKLAIPVVFAPVNDPVAAGVVKSLKNPGGNITGVRLASGDALRLQWLRELVPGVRRVLVPYSPWDKSAIATLEEIRSVAGKLGFELVEQPMTGSRGLMDVMRMAARGTDAVFLPRDSTVEAQIEQFTSLARARRIPLCVPSVTQVEKGGLFSYGFVHRDIGMQAARLASLILRGARPGDLPVETAENRLALNLRTAQIIGLPVSDHFLRQAALIIRE